MQCGECQADNQSDAVVCGHCGVELYRYCPSCRSRNRPQAKFCDECGGALATSAHATNGRGEDEGRSESLISEHSASEAERRQLTVMFCDLIDSTELSELLDPEELRDVIGAYQARSTAAIARFGGHVAKYLGDGILAYFGYPQAHEDSAQRAVRAGLEIVAAMPQLNAELGHSEALRRLPLRVRVGVHTGLVVIGEMGAGASRESMAIVGETPNVAARIEALAAPDTVAVSVATKKLVEAHFTCQSLGRQALKGISAPVELFRILGESEEPSHAVSSGGPGVNPMVGRRKELELLLERWERAQHGQSQVVLLSGEPGIGKTRLMRELKERVAQEGHTHIELRCLPYYQSTALHPVSEHLRQLLQFARDESPQQKVAKLKRKLKTYGLPADEAAALFAPLLSLPHPEDYPTLELSASRQKQKTMEALIALLVAEAGRNPVLAVWEDLHWADASTLELLDLFVQLAPAARILVLLTFRPDFTPPWTPRAQMPAITLSRLPGADVRTMVERMAQGKPLAPQVIEQIVSKTDGVPLFVEELTKMLLEQGWLGERNDRYEPASMHSGLAIPATLQDLLMTRLGQLAPARRVAQLAAALGREFRYDFLRVVSPWAEAALDRGLTCLVNAELLYQRGVPPHATYMFKHALIQEAAYQSLLKSKRKEYHARIAGVLEERFPETAQTQPELVAHHLTRAGLAPQAADYWCRAGQRAIERSSNLEAITQLKNGLDVLSAIPQGLERAQRELAMQSLLGMALIFAKGYSEREVEQAYARARELCGQLGETPLLYPVMWGLWAYYLVRGNYESAHDIGQQLLGMAERQNDDELLLEAHVIEGLNRFYGGSDLPRARAHFERVGSLYEPLAHGSHALTYGQDPGVVALAALSWVLWLEGYPDQALAAHRECLKLAHARSHQYSLAYALSYGATFHQFRRDAQEAQALAQRAIALSTECGFPMWMMAASYTLGWTMTRAGEGDKAVAYLRGVVQAWHGLGAQITRPHQLGLLADALAGAGRAEEALQVLREALDEAQETSERHYEPELHRLIGELHLLKAAPDEEQACAAFLRSLECAQGLGAKSWELRAATSLARLRLRQGQRAQARVMLEGVYQWFTEGFDTPDLCDAKALLAELA